MADRRTPARRARHVRDWDRETLNARAALTWAINHLAQTRQRVERTSTEDHSAAGDLLLAEDRLLRARRYLQRCEEASAAAIERSRRPLAITTKVDPGSHKEASERDAT